MYSIIEYNYHKCILYDKKNIQKLKRSEIILYNYILQLYLEKKNLLNNKKGKNIYGEDFII